MPGSRNTSYLCAEARNWTGIYDRSLLRDGFEQDKGQSPLAIVPALNWAITKLLLTGQYKCYFTLPLTEDQSQYELDTAIGRIVVTTYTTDPATDPIQTPMKKTRITTLDTIRPGWRNADSGIPVAYHTDVPDIIEVWPKPNVTDATGYPSLTILAEATSSDLVHPDDVPQRLPVQFHEGLAIGAAMRICFARSREEPAMLARYTELKTLWATEVANVQSDANNREQDESSQMMVNDTYRNRISAFPTNPLYTAAGNFNEGW